MDEQQRVNEMIKNSYVPSIEDLHAGYICIADIGDGAMWQIGVKLTPDDIRWVDAGIEKIRTPYLTAEQIEAEGWINKGEHDMGYFKRCLFAKGNYMLCLHLKEGNIPVISISVLDLVKPLDWVDKLHEDVYLSFPENYKTIIPCPSINEFRKIVGLLGIK